MSSISAREISYFDYDPTNHEYLFVVDRYNDRIVRVHIATGDMSEFVGKDDAPYADGVGTNAGFSRPHQFAVSKNKEFI